MPAYLRSLTVPHRTVPYPLPSLLGLLQGTVFADPFPTYILHRAREVDAHIKLCPCLATLRCPTLYHGQT